MTAASARVALSRRRMLGINALPAPIAMQFTCVAVIDGAGWPRAPVREMGSEAILRSLQVLS